MTFYIHEKNRDKKVNSMIYKKIETFSVKNGWEMANLCKIP